MKAPVFRRLAAKISALSVLLVTITILFFAISIYIRDYRSLEKQYGLSLQRIVTIAAQQIDGDLHDQIRQTQDAKLPAFQKIKQILQRVQKVYGLKKSHICTFRILSKHRLAFAVTLRDKPFVGDKFKIVKANRKIFARTQLNKKPTYTRMYQNKNGMWISAYAPILNAQGEYKGILKADIQIDRFYYALQRELQWLVLLSLLGILLAIIVSILFAQRLNRALRQLTQGVEAIKVNDYNHHIELERRDELGVLAKQFNEMADMIAERVDMLKYLPKHTLEAIARRSRTGSVYETEYVKGTVVFTDLRGYTSLSETLSPEQMIETLNKYLQKQAEIFDRYGGVIDKLIGDGVLVVFKDFAHIHRAVEAGLDIQKSTKELNETEDFPVPLEIGIGIATGHLVFGEIGSDLRKERILIGSEVNLASRLSNLAEAGEVIVSDQVRHQLGQALEVSKTEEVEITGFSEKQVIHNIVEIGSFASQKTWTM